MIICGHAVKTLGSKEIRASNEITVTHNSVFAAHRLQCRMTTRKIDIRHFVAQKKNRKQEPQKREFDFSSTLNHQP
jgi:hypothetical protein